MTWFARQIYDAEAILKDIKREARKLTSSDAGKIKALRQRVKRLDQWIDEVVKYERTGIVTLACGD